MLLLELQLHRVLDRDDPLVLRNERRQHVQQGGLSGAGPAGHDDVEPSLHAGVQQFRHLRGERAEGDQVADVERVLGELADGQRGTVEGQWRHHGIDPGTVGEAGVHQWGRFVDPPADPGDNALDHPPQVFLGGEPGGGAHQFATALDVDHVGSVDHDLGDGPVVQQRLQRTIAEHFVVDVAEQPLPLLCGERDVLLLDDVRQFLSDQRVQLLLVQAGVVEPGTHPLEQCFARAFPQCAQRVDRRHGDCRCVAPLHDRWWRLI